jgi:thiamine monophosphate synthase
MYSLYAIADRDQFERASDWLTAIERVAPALACHPDRALQLRWKRATPDREEFTRRARALLSGVVTFTNGPESSGFSGEHVPEARLMEGAIPRGAWVAASVHSREALQRAEAAGVRFVVYGPVFSPGSHPGDPVGVAALRQMCEATRLPVVAIGGITPERVEACVFAGAVGVAAVTGIFRAADPAAMVDRYATAVAAHPFQSNTRS